MKAKESTWSELIAKVVGEKGPKQEIDLQTAEYEATLLLAAQRTKATHIVLFENHQMDSSALGESSSVCVGPTCTYKTPADTDGKWLNDLPSQRQYPVMYAAVPK